MVRTKRLKTMISFWIIASFVIVIILVVLLMVKGVTQELENPGCVAHGYDEDDPAITALNVLSNVLFAVAGIIFMIAGYPIEASALFLLTMCSTFWHGLGESVWRIADHVFCLLNTVLFLGVFFRLVCINGWPLLSVLYIGLILGGAACFPMHDLHVFWHVLVAMFVFALGIETINSPGLISNPALRKWVKAQLQTRLNRSCKQQHSLMLVDLFRKKQCGSMIMT